MCAEIFSEAKFSNADACEWYWVNIVVDTTVGTVICFYLVRTSECLLRYKSGSYLVKLPVLAHSNPHVTSLPTSEMEPISSSNMDLCKSDQDISINESEPIAPCNNFTEFEYRIQYRIWFGQLCLWLAIVSIMKACMVLLMGGFAEFWASVTNVVIGPFTENPNLKLFLVMVVTPLCMNTFQLWFTDAFLKHNPVVNSGAFNTKGAENCIESATFNQDNSNTSSFELYGRSCNPKKRYASPQQTEEGNLFSKHNENVFKRRFSIEEMNDSDLVLDPGHQLITPPRRILSQNLHLHEEEFGIESSSERSFLHVSTESGKKRNNDLVMSPLSFESDENDAEFEWKTKSDWGPATTAADREKDALIGRENQLSK